MSINLGAVLAIVAVVSAFLAVAIPLGSHVLAMRAWRRRLETVTARDFETSMADWRQLMERRGR